LDKLAIDPKLDINIWLDPICVEKYSGFPELDRLVIAGKRGTEATGIVLETEAVKVD